tara:strand:+ start:961 stop:1254 length:294 start_codon:yes stop_codon:yes gene_type:complete
MEYDIKERELNYESIVFCRTLAKVYLRKDKIYQQRMQREMEEAKREKDRNAGWVSWAWDRATTMPWGSGGMATSLALDDSIWKELYSSVKDNQVVIL